MLPFIKKGGYYGKKKSLQRLLQQKASKALQDGRSSDRTKSIAGSALSQREKKKINLFFLSKKMPRQTIICQGIFYVII
jgi:hypothetical protein